MAGEQGTGASTGAAAPAGGAPTAPIGGSPAPTTVGGGSGVGGDAAATTAGSGVKSIPEDVLPPELRGRSPQEQRFILSQLGQTLAQQKQELDRLRQSGGSRAAVADDDEDETPPSKKRPIEERILEDPENVILEVVGKRYGPLVQRLEDNVETAVEATVAQQMDDWEEMKPEVYALLRDAQAPKTKENIQMAYDTVLGRRTREQRRLALAQSQNPDIPVDDGTGGDGFAPLTGLEKEVFEASGMSRADWEKYGDSGNLEIRVPDGKKRSNG